MRTTSLVGLFFVAFSCHEGPRTHSMYASEDLDAGEALSDSGAADTRAADTGTGTIATDADVDIVDGGSLVRPDVPRPTGAAVSFVLNAQDFSYADLALATMERLLAIHNEAAVPLDIYMTDTMYALLEDSETDLESRLAASPFIQFNYHTRPPKPYRTGYDWTGELAAMSEEERQALIREYETHVTDLELGTPTAREGGLFRLHQMYGGPIAVGAAADEGIVGSVEAVFAELGAAFFVQHSARAINLGDRNSRSMLLRPEHLDLPLIHTWEPAHAEGGCHQAWDENGRDVLADAVERACDAEGSEPPCIVGVKIHDNDMFACDSAWTTVYLSANARRDGPPFPVELRSELLSEEETERRWAFYEDMVSAAAENREAVPTIGIEDVARWLE